MAKVIPAGVNDGGTAGRKVMLVAFSSATWEFAFANESSSAKAISRAPQYLHFWTVIWIFHSFSAGTSQGRSPQESPAVCHSWTAKMGV